MKVREWSDRPREKLVERGAASLTDLELVAVLVGTGTATEHVLDVARKMLETADNSLSRLALLPIHDLISIPGIGHAKAVNLKAGIEFARRTQFERTTKDFKVVTSKDAFMVFGPNLGDLPHEEFWVAFLNRRANIISKSRLSQGGLSSTVVDPRILFKWALNTKASTIIVAHNHPSGNLNPSQADIDLTKKLQAGGKILDIQLVDHLIISGNNYCSFADSGLL